MAYLALYRRFRPQGFEGLIGQEHVVKILKNQINAGKIGHAYLFCGARGTGKTTVAKIFARAINCVHPVNGSPCGKCEVCEGLKDPSNMDILEMDAASNNGVDDIREMRDKIQYPPVVGKYKVYIVDEVHMLSPAAFNALLKTLEEPPAHAVFIFATTEVHKIPQTILSRCMRFDFRLIPQPELAALVRKVFDETGKEYDDAAVDAIARAGEGSARDSLSIADMCSSYSVGKLTYSDVLDVLGATDKTKVLNLVENIILGNTGSALETVNELAMLGRNMGVLANDIALTLRDLIVCNTAADANSVLGLPKERFEEYSRVARNCSGYALLRLTDIFTSLDNAFRYSSHPRIVLETAVVRACRPESDYDIEALLSRMARLENALENGAIRDAKPAKYIKEVPQNTQKPQVEEQNVTDKNDEPVKKADPPAFNEANETAAGNTEEETAANDTEEEDDTGVLPDFDLFSIPPEEPQAFTGFLREEGVAPVKKQPVKENVPPAKVWGNVLKTLRNNGNAVLWTVCQDVSARAENGVLTLTVSSGGEYDMFTREEHIKTLTDAANLFGDYVVKVVKSTGDNAAENFEKDIRYMKQTFGEDVVKIIKNN